MSQSSRLNKLRQAFELHFGFTPATQYASVADDLDEPISEKLKPREWPQRVMVMSLIAATASISWLVWLSLRPRQSIFPLLPAASITSREDWQLSGAADPIHITKMLSYDTSLHLHSLPTEVEIGKTFEILFNCTYDDEGRCPTSYKALLEGPSLVSPDWTASSHAVSRRQVRVTAQVSDPGFYKLYAWPEHQDCENEDDSLAVSFTPRDFVAVGQPSPLLSQTCMASGSDATHQQLLFSNGTVRGRWVDPAFVNPKLLLSSEPMAANLRSHLSPVALNGHSGPSRYIFLPETCLLPRMDYQSWLDLLRPDNVVWFGDSTLRDPFCFLLVPQLRNVESVTGCTYDDLATYHLSNKEVVYRHSDNTTARLAFLWAPYGDPSTVGNYLSKLASNGLNLAIMQLGGEWLAHKSPDEYLRHIEPALAVAARQEHVISVFRTAVSPVQAIQCYELARIQRHAMEPNNQAVLRLLGKYPSIVPLDAFAVFNARPDASSDGRHFSTLRPNATIVDRPGIDEAEQVVASLSFYALWKQVHTRRASVNRR